MTRMNTVTRDEYSAFVTNLSPRADWKPIETTTQAIMQITMDGDLLGQAIYTKGVATIENGVVSGVVYQIAV